MVHSRCPSTILLALAATPLGCSHDAPKTHVVAIRPAPTAEPVTQRVEVPAAKPASPSPSASPSSAPSSAPASGPAPPAGPRLWSKARHVWIQAQPRASKGWLGYLGLGSSIALKGGSVEAAKVRGSEGRSGCRAWYAVEPRGYICDGDAATLDDKDPMVVAVAASAPKTDSPWPYDYGESIGAPRYKHAPSAAEQRKTEWDLVKHMRLVAGARAGEAVDKEIHGVELSPAAPTRWGAVPSPSDLVVATGLVRDARKRIALGSTIAYTRQVDIDGRVYLVTHDLALIPKDRVKPYPQSEFHGVEIDDAHALPLAFFRKTDRPKYRRAADGSFEKTSESWPRLASVGLTGDEVKDGKTKYLATREAGMWVLASDASVARLKEPPSHIRRATTGRRTWLDISVLGGTMVAYEGDKPVYATLISPGRGGVPVRGVDAIETASTPTGTFRVDGKFVTATMVSSTNDSIVHTEVQYVLNFHGPHAIHAAYWHDRWGEKKSGGCVNLSPIDAKRIFAWTDPPMPTDWYGLRALPELGAATVVAVHK